MKPLWVDKSTPATIFAALLFVLFLGHAGDCAAQPVPTMTIKIFNNSCQPACQAGEQPYNIYPVLTMGQGPVDSWLQAALSVPKSTLNDNPYPRGRSFRLYFNPTGDGIPPGGHVKITLPLYTQLVPTANINPKSPDQYIDWWQGGTILIYDNLAAHHSPPAALTADYTGASRPDQAVVTPIPTAALPVCPLCQQPLKIFKDTGDLPKNDPSQLLEYTLGV